jgi:hypothetical protein
MLRVYCQYLAHSNSFENRTRALNVCHKQIRREIRGESLQLSCKQATPTSDAIGLAVLRCGGASRLMSPIAE